MGTNVLVVGGGAREHALGWGIAQSPGVGKLFFAPGNAGTADIGKNVSWWDPKRPLLEQWITIQNGIEEKNIGLVVIGPEGPLAEGLADMIRKMGVPVFGFSARMARLESSKDFAKGIANKAWVPTAPYKNFICSEWRDAIAYVEGLGVNIPVVLKADGLEGGKGVLLPVSLNETVVAIEQLGKKGCSGNQFIVEERFFGDELSLHALVSRGSFSTLVATADEKRASKEPNAPNTGGMGAYGPVPWVGRKEIDLYEELFVRRVLRYCRDVLKIDPNELNGCLYPGLMVTPDQGPKLLEWNARFGNPEAQAIMRLWKISSFGNPLLVLDSCARGTYNPHMMGPYWHSGRVVCVTLAARGYPGDVSAVQGALIRGIERAETIPRVKVFHGGTARDSNGDPVVAGGRVLSVTAVADTFREARERVYEAIPRITFGALDSNLVMYRDDIGLKAEKWEKDNRKR
ncbi:MAG: phosphoribosylamine--glycine ligase [Parcubacteria group bacterium]|nr:phosphoribosylamine--glycine ligase [Parcubacteria group bacterium]